MELDGRRNLLRAARRWPPKRCRIICVGEPNATPFGRAQATADDPAALDRALAAAAAVINTAGPFAVTAHPAKAQATFAVDPARILQMWEWVGGR